MRDLGPLYRHLPLRVRFARRGRRLTIATVLASVLVVGGVAHGVDQLLPGLRLVLKDTTGRQKAVLTIKNSGVAAPLPGGADDPTVIGATMEFINPNSGEHVTFDMPASNWSVNSSGTFRFFNRDAPAPPSEVKLTVLKNGLIKVRAGCRPCAPPRVFEPAGMTLNEPSQGSIGFVLTIGSRKYCALFANPLQDEPGRFMARNSLPPSSCPVVPPSSPSLAFID